MAHERRRLTQPRPPHWRDCWLYPVPRRRQIPGEWTPGPGSAIADRMRRDRRERPRRGGRERDNSASRKTAVRCTRLRAV